MKSTITVRSKFDFRGESFCYEGEIALPDSFGDFDLFLEQLPHRLAKLNDLTTLSYKFEMLESSEIEVIKFQSKIASSIADLPMRVDRFLELYEEIGPDAHLAVIAEEHQLDLQANPQLAKALKEAYLLGNRHKPKEKPQATTWW
ncbi:hypothetical protein [Thiomicrorhabdus xiamenensis]|uniref:Uncharacterized protein n=1 Tax=Thiomicrorhabdus xiamenensis TaxID=2739063 RepID=A0A7D4SP03_9GAMM|nr:hypothetical protein [Thiomicrorhabdus xiamenensis]QKI90021.1 hypothetical protein HQN79_10770 [Thiomicrorhabdus xiamenensis]